MPSAQHATVASAVSAPVERLAIRYDDGSINVLTSLDLEQARHERDIDDGSTGAEIIRVSLAVLEVIEPATATEPV